MSAVTIIEQQLEAARAEEAKSRREAAKQKIEELRREGAMLLKELRPLAKQVREAQRERLRLHGLLVQARNNILAFSQQLNPLDFPSDEKIAEQAQQLETWKNRQKELLAQHARSCEREAVRSQAVALQRKLDHLQYSISNLTAVSEGRLPGQLDKGGLSTCEDFIGNLQTAHL